MLQAATSRRGFVAGAAATTALVAATSQVAFADEAAAPAQWDAELPQSWDREAEMVVVGCGIAGTCALLEGYELGLDVLGIEAGDDIKKCSCKLSGGWFAGACTSLQDDAGIVDDVELMVKDVRNDGGDFGDPDVIRAWCELSGDTIDWLWDLGVDLVPQVFDAKSAGSNSHSLARCYQANPVGDGLGWMTGIENALNDYGVEILYETRATKLYRNAEGRVVGVRAQTADGSEINVQATKGVLVSAGGLGSDIDLWAVYAPVMRDIAEQAKTVVSAAPLTVQGDSAILLRDVNAFMYPTIANYGGAGIVIDPEKPGDGNVSPYIWSDGLIEVNANGERFFDESNFSIFFGDKPYRDQPGMWNVCIFDDEWRQSSGGQAQAQNVIDSCAEHGITDTVFSADTIEELAEHWGMDPAALVAAVDDFNARVDSQEADQFGRTNFGQKIATPPFWGIELNVIVATSKGGAKINAKGEVIDNFEQVIPGLYGAGESAFFPCQGNGKEHVVGGCNSAAACYGRICARSIAQA